MKTKIKIDLDLEDESVEGRRIAGGAVRCGGAARRGGADEIDLDRENQVDYLGYARRDTSNLATTQGHQSTYHSAVSDQSTPSTNLLHPSRAAPVVVIVIRVFAFNSRVCTRQREFDSVA